MWFGECMIYEVRHCRPLIYKSLSCPVDCPGGRWTQMFWCQHVLSIPVTDGQVSFKFIFSILKHNFWLGPCTLRLILFSWSGCGLLLVPLRLYILGVLYVWHDLLVGDLFFFCPLHCKKFSWIVKFGDMVYVMGPLEGIVPVCFWALYCGSIVG